ncbi:MAG: flagellar biosynthesis protein FlhF [Candidatus Accumulibacter sp.]|uniref:flagellar biosynthesis protein FlhF n=1 Tax=Accumulibacter sp. TaxID=2053492 RepID=UPI0028794BB4|nr:flagellar biosynthesis protein FlhF [Accumulibacter sp.]MDS4016184.1 flagellar biosynthesis protein FlhF [Accumulibacter sp.]
MNVRKFIAATARDALRKVKETLGPDAIILSNRGIPGGVEIMAVAARDMEMMVATPERPTPVRRPEVSAHRPEPPAVAPALPEAARPPVVAASPPTRFAASPPNAPSSVPARSAALAQRPQASDEARPEAGSAGKAEADVVPAAVVDEIRALRRIVEHHLAGFAYGDQARAEPVKTEMLRQMLDAGFSPQFARELLAGLPRELEASSALAWVKGSADQCMLTISSDTDVVDRGGVYALVGPTGVGKTTTTAKLAARCVLRHGARKLALVTTDGYRIGAHEQLRIYGRILGVPVHLARDAHDLRATLNDLQHTHMVLIDTMGMSQRDRMVSEQVAMFAQADVKSLLLLSATSRGDTLDDVVRAYAGLRLAGCILTKVDEAAGLASSLDVIIRHRLRMFYVSNGQRVPEDLHLPNRSYLLHRAFKDLPDGSPHHLDGAEPGLLMASAGAWAASAGGRCG